MNASEKANQRFIAIEKIIASCVTITQLNTMNKFILRFEQDCSPIEYGKRSIYVIGLNSILERLFLLKLEMIVRQQILNAL